MSLGLGEKKWLETQVSEVPHISLQPLIKANSKDGTDRDCSTKAIAA